MHLHFTLCYSTPKQLKQELRTIHILKHMQSTNRDKHIIYTRRGITMEDHMQMTDIQTIVTSVVMELTLEVAEDFVVVFVFLFAACLLVDLKTKMAITLKEAMLRHN